MSVATELQCPQAINGEWFVVCAEEGAFEAACDGVEGVDGPVTEIADEQTVSESAEVCGSECDARRCVEGIAVAEHLDEIAVSLLCARWRSIKIRDMSRSDLLVEFELYMTASSFNSNLCTPPLW